MARVRKERLGTRVGNWPDFKTFLIAGFLEHTDGAPSPLRERVKLQFSNWLSECCRLWWSERVRGALSDNRGMQEPITRDPEVMHGTPVFRGTRVPVKTMFEYLENGEFLDNFLEGFPTVTSELAVQVLEESRELRLARV